MASTRLGFVAVEHARARARARVVSRSRRAPAATSPRAPEPRRRRRFARPPVPSPRSSRAPQRASVRARGRLDPVRLGTPARVFSTPEDLMAHFADALASTPRDTDIHDRVMLDALRAHPDARAKIGAGAACLQVRQHASKRYDSFVVVRADGTFDDFSYRKCVEALFPGFAKRPKTSASTRDDRPGSSRGDSKPSTSASTAKAAAALNAHISKQASVESLLAIVRERADELDRIHVAAAFVRLGKIVAAAESPFVESSRPTRPVSKPSWTSPSRCVRTIADSTIAAWRASRTPLRASRRRALGVLKPASGSTPARRVRAHRRVGASRRAGCGVHVVAGDV